jgi:hypothetical protein
MPTSGHKIQFGVDTYVNPAANSTRALALDSVNRMYRGGRNDTRLPFQLLKLDFQSEADRELFEKGSVTGVKGYNGVPPYTKSHLVVTVGKCVFVAQIMGDTAYMVKIYDGLDPQYLHQFFVQGESILVINDGKNEGIFWNGQVSEMKKISESEWVTAGKEMPIGNISIYAHGRLWITTEDGRLYAGDHLYSQGNAASDEVLLSFTESFYPASGDGFTATSEWGEVRALAVVSRDPSTNGHGEVICFHVNGAYAVMPLDDRNQWTNENIQQTVFTGQGACSPWSIVSINNDLLFRRSDKRIGTLRQTASQKATSLQIVPFGTEVHQYLNYDTFDRLRYSMSGADDERVFYTVNHEVVDNDALGGKHRFGNGLVVCDFASGSNASPDTISWDGLWTGPRVTGIAEVLFGTEKKCVFASYDTDGVNRLYILRRFRGPDILTNGPREIESMYSFGAMFDGIAPDSSNNVGQYNIQGSAVFYDNAVGQCTVSSSYRSALLDHWVKLYDERTIGQEPESDVMLYDMTRDILLPGSPCSVTESSGRLAQYGTQFIVRTEIKGSVMITANLLQGEVTQMSLSYNSPCPKKIGQEQDAYNYFKYQF